NIEIYIKKNIILLIILETGIGDIFAQNVDTTNFILKDKNFEMFFSDNRK
ncbi:Uncharacterized protein GNX_3173, partial [Leptospira interrogans serovar Canicola]